jgi:Alginate lyase
LLVARQLNLFSVCLLLGLSQQNALALECSIPISLPTIDAIKVYTDPEGSVAPQHRVKLNNELLDPLREQMLLLERTLIDNKECSIMLLAHWAKNSAFIDDNINTAERRHRIRVVTAINIALLKLKNRSIKIEETIVDWITELNLLLIKDFGLKESKKYHPTNLVSWSAAAVSLHLFLNENETMQDYVNSAWDAAVNSISKSGYLNRELGRGKRSLYYHQYHLSALNLLAYIRENLQLPIGREQAAAVSRLSARVTLGLCNPETFVRDAPIKLPVQFVPNGLDFDVGALFGDKMYKEKMQTCGFFPRNMRNEFFNGDIRDLKNLLDHQ